MADEPGFDGMTTLQIALREMPENLGKRVIRSWARKWSQQAHIAAQIAAPKGKTKNLTLGLRRRDAKASRLKTIGSLARSVVIGAKPAFHFHIVNLGTKPRWTTGYGKPGKRGTRARLRQALAGALHKRAYRGVMPANPFLVKAARPLMAQAEADLRRQVGLALRRFLIKEGRL